MPEQDSAFISDIAFTPSVKAEQEKRGSRDMVRRIEESGRWTDRIDDNLAAFLAERDSAYLATVNADGQPYIQHRGGPKGFLKVVDDRHIGFADFVGNRQYITLGNLEDNPKAFLFLMDYAQRRRVKIWGRAKVVEDDPALVERLSDLGYRAKPERAILFEVSTWDVNCPQHIVPRVPAVDAARIVETLQAKLAELQAENTALRARLGG